MKDLIFFAPVITKICCIFHFLYRFIISSHFSAYQRTPLRHFVALFPSRGRKNFSPTQKPL